MCAAQKTAIAKMLNLETTKEGNQLRCPCPICKGTNKRAIVITPAKWAYYCFSCEIRWHRYYARRQCQKHFRARSRNMDSRTKRRIHVEQFPEHFPDGTGRFRCAKYAASTETITAQQLEMLASLMDSRKCEHVEMY
jgi:hypothetical protein